MSKFRVAVLGLDGVDWTLVSDWSARGSLPNFKRLMEEGAGGVLESTVPPTTPPGWTSITTGVNPGKHGLFDFFRVLRRDGSWSFELVNSTHKRAPELWDYVDGSFVINLPVSYPARPIRGVMITGMLTPSRRADFAHPPELRDWLLRRFPDYRFELRWSDYGDRKEEFMRDLTRMTEQRFQLFWELFERDWRLMFFVIAGTDRIQHLMWGTPEMMEYFRTVDGFLGDVMDRALRAGINLLVVSDHGFGPIDRHLYVNSYLYREGYLRLRGGRAAGVMRAVGLDRERLRGLLYRTGLIRLYRRLSPRAAGALRAAIPGGSNPSVDFDLQRTRAFMYGMGGIYLAARGDERRRLIGELREGLLTLRDPDTGGRVVEAVYERGEIYSGPLVGEAPDLVLVPASGYSVERHVRSRLVEASRVKRADHRRTGVIFAYGPDVEPGARVDASVYDIAPTVLHMLGLPVPTNVDGRVLLELFSPSSEPRRREVSFREPLRLPTRRREVSLAVRRALAKRGTRTPDP